MFGFFESSLQSLDLVVAKRDSCSHTVLAGTFHYVFEDGILPGGLNLKDFGIQWFLMALCMKFK